MKRSALRDGERIFMRRSWNCPTGIRRRLVQALGTCREASANAWGSLALSWEFPNSSFSMNQRAHWTHAMLELIRQTLSEASGDTTIVLVAHRSATLQVCTRVIEVKNGVLREVAPGAAEQSTSGT